MKMYARYQHEAVLAPELVQAHIPEQSQELTESQLLERCAQLRNTILACDYAYYGLNSSVVNDFVYDALRRELKFYEQQYPEVVRTLGEFVATERVGSELLEEPTLQALISQVRDNLGLIDLTQLFALPVEQAQILVNILEEQSNQNFYVEEYEQEDTDLEEVPENDSNSENFDQDVESNVRYIELVQKKTVYTPEQLVKFFADINPEQVDELMQPYTQQSLNHVQQMLSLSNVYVAEDFLNFVATCRKTLGLAEQQPLELCAEPKLDGIACSIVYENGKIARAVTRGDGVKGFDITNHVRRIPNVPQSLAPFVEKFEQEGINSTLEVRGELIMFQEEFEYLNQLYRAHNKKALVNLRNSAGAFVSLDPFRRVTSQSWVSDNNGQKRRSFNLAVVDNLPRVMPIRFCAYSVNQYQVGNEYFLKGTHYDLLMYMRELGFTVSELVKKVSNVKEYLEYYENIRNKRESLGFDIDGTVFKVNDLQLQSNIGWIANSPKWAVAFKFPPSKATTIIENVVTQVGRLGSISPVAKVQTCFLSGTNISSISLHNHYLFKSLNLHQGDTVVIYRGGEVIPVLKEALVEKRLPNVQPMQLLPLCPECGEFLDSDLTSRELQSIVKTTDCGLDYKLLDGFLSSWGGSSAISLQLLSGKTQAPPEVKVITKIDIIGNAYCNAESNQYCGGRTRQQIEYFFSKNGIEVKGLGSSFVDFGVYSGYLQSYADVYKLLNPEYRQAANSKILSLQSLYPVFVLNYYNQVLQLENFNQEFEKHIEQKTQEVHDNLELVLLEQQYEQQRQRFRTYINQADKLELIFAPLELETKFKHLYSQIVNYPRYELINFSKYLVDPNYVATLQVPLTLEERLLQSKTDKMTETFFVYVNEYEVLNYQAQLFINSLQWVEHLPYDVLAIDPNQNLPTLSVAQKQKLQQLRIIVTNCIQEVATQKSCEKLDTHGLFKEIDKGKVSLWSKLVTLLQRARASFERKADFEIFTPHKYQGKGEELVAKLIAEFGQWMIQGKSSQVDLTAAQIELAARDPLFQWTYKSSDSEIQELYAEIDRIAHKHAEDCVSREKTKDKKTSRIKKEGDEEHVYDDEFRKKRVSEINRLRYAYKDFALVYFDHVSELHDLSLWIEYLALRLWTSGQALALSRPQFMLLFGVMQSQLYAGVDLESIYGTDYLERFRVILKRALISRKDGLTTYRTFFKAHGDSYVGFNGVGNYTTQPIPAPQQEVQRIEQQVTNLRHLRKLLIGQLVISPVEYTTDSVLMVERAWNLESASEGFTATNLRATNNTFAESDWVWQREYERTIFAPLFTEYGLEDLVVDWKSRKAITQQLINKLVENLKATSKVKLILGKILPLLLNDVYSGINIKAFSYLQQELLSILAGFVNKEVRWRVGDNLLSWIVAQNWEDVEEEQLNTVLDLITALLTEKVTITQLQNCVESELEQDYGQFFVNDLAQETIETPETLIDSGSANSEVTSEVIISQEESSIVEAVAANEVVSSESDKEIALDELVVQLQENLVETDITTEVEEAEENATPIVEVLDSEVTPIVEATEDNETPEMEVSEIESATMLEVTDVVTTIVEVAEKTEASGKDVVAEATVTSVEEVIEVQATKIDDTPVIEVSEAESVTVVEVTDVATTIVEVAEKIEDSGEDVVVETAVTSREEVIEVAATKVDETTEDKDTSVIDVSETETGSAVEVTDCVTTVADVAEKIEDSVEEVVEIEATPVLEVIDAKANAEVNVTEQDKDSVVERTETIHEENLKVTSQEVTQANKDLKTVSKKSKKTCKSVTKKKSTQSKAQLEKAQEVLEQLAATVNSNSRSSNTIETTNDLGDLFGDMDELMEYIHSANCVASSDLAVANMSSRANRFLTRVAQFLESCEETHESCSEPVGEIPAPEINLSDSFYWQFLEDYAHMISLIRCKYSAKVETSLKSSYSTEKILELCGNNDVPLFVPDVKDCSSLAVINYLFMNFSTELGILQAGKSTYIRIRDQVLNSKPFIHYYRTAKEKFKAELNVGIFALQDLLDEYKVNDLQTLIQNPAQKFYLSLNVRNQLVKSCSHFAQYLEQYPAYALSYAPRYRAYLQMLIADRRQRMLDTVIPLASSYKNVVATTKEINQTTNALLELDKLSSLEQVEQIASCFRQLLISQATQFEKIDKKRLDGEFSGKTYTKIFEALAERKLIYMEDFLKSIGIDNFGEITANILLGEDFYPNIESLINFESERLTKYLYVTTKTDREKAGLVGIGDNLIKYFVDYFSTPNNRYNISQLIAQGVEVTRRPVAFTNKFKGNKVAVTGTLQALGRKQFSDFIKESGGTYSSSITSDTNYLVVAGEFNPESTGLSVKIKKAMLNGKTQIVPEAEFMEIYNSSQK